MVKYKLTQIWVFVSISSLLQSLSSSCLFLQLSTKLHLFNLISFMMSVSVWLLANPIFAKSHFSAALLDFEVIVFFGDQSFFPLSVGSLLMLNVIFKMVILLVRSGKFSYNRFFFSLTGIQIPDSFSRFDIEKFQAASKIKSPSSLLQLASLNSYLGLHPNSAACTHGAVPVVPVAWSPDSAQCQCEVPLPPDSYAQISFSSKAKFSLGGERPLPRFCPHILGIWPRPFFRFGSSTVLQSVVSLDGALSFWKEEL